MFGAISWRRVAAFIEQRMGRSTPCEKLLVAQPVAPSYLRHVGARLQALLHDAGVVVTRLSAPPPGARDQRGPPHVRDAVNDIDPLAWLADVLARIADMPQSRLPGTFFPKPEGEEASN